MKPDHRITRSPRRSLWFTGLAAAGLLPLGTTSLSAQTTDTWDGGTGNWSNGSLWSTGGVPNSASADVYIDGGKTGTASVVSLNNDYTVGRLTVDAGDTFNVNNDDEFTFSNGAFDGSGSIVNNGTINVNDSGSGTYLRFSGAGSISGNGTINLSGPNAQIFANDGGDRLTIGAGQTIAGTGNLGSQTTTITNNGIVTANVNGGTLKVRPGDGTADFTNAGAGVARAENGGTLELAAGGTFTGGSFTALNGSTVQIDNGTTEASTTLATVGTGTVTFNDANAAVNNVTVASGSTVAVNNNSEVTLTGTFTNNGTVNVKDAGNGTFLILGGATTLGGNGTINLSGPNAQFFANNVGDRLTIGAGQTIAGTGNLGERSTTFTNNGTINANVNGGTLTIQPGGGTADFTNHGGTLQAQNGGTLAFSNASGGTLDNTNGLFNVLDGSTLTVVAGALTNFSGTTLTGGQYLVSAASASSPATLSFGGGSIVTNDATVELDGPGAVFNEINALATNASGGFFSLSGGRNFTTQGALTNAGSVVVEASSTLTVSGGLNNSGLTLLYDGGTVAVQGNTVNTGKVQTQGGAFTVQGALTSSGVLQTSLFSEAGTIAVTGALTQTANGTLAGSGSVTAPTLSLAGSLRPGDNAYGTGFLSAVGTLTLNGQVGLLGNTVLVFDLASTATSDRITVNGALTLAGMLNVNALTGFSAGRYDLIDYTGALTNDGLALGTLPSGYNYAVDTSMAGQVDLVVTNAVPEPSTWAGLLGGCGLLLIVRRRRVAGHA